MSGPNGATPGAPVALRYPLKGTELNGGGSALATPAEPVPRRSGQHLGARHFLTFRWQPHGTISARPVTELQSSSTAAS